MTAKQTNPCISMPRFSRENKQFQVARPRPATLAWLTESTGWQRHNVRGFMANAGLRSAMTRAHGFNERRNLGRYVFKRLNAKIGRVLSGCPLQVRYSRTMRQVK